MLKYRAISFPILMGLLWAIFFAPVNIGMWVFTLCAVAAIGVATYECGKMVDTGLIPCFPKTAGIVSAALVACTLVPDCLFNSGREAALINAIVTFAVAFLLLFTVYLPWLAVVFGGAETAKRGFATLVVVSMTAIPFGMLTIFYFPDPKYLFFIMMVTKSMDTGGYVFGMLSNKLLPGGNHKLCPSISPKKSWEGAAGGVLLSVLTAWALYAIFPNWDFSIHLGEKALWKILVFGALLAVASIAGDLTESALKRKCGVKDSGNIIPGMGGPLDVLDSFIYVAPVCLLYSLVLNLLHL